MPSKTDKQKKFFGAVMGAKKGQSGASGKAKEVAKEMPKKEIKKFLKKEGEEDEQMKVKAPKVKERMRSSGTVDGRTKSHKPKKGKGSYDRKDTLKENVELSKFLECLLLKNYAEANKYLHNVVEYKLQQKIEQELTTPLFQ